MQAVVTPFWQLGQLPSLKANGEITRSPLASVRTLAPMSSTMPMNSWPIGPALERRLAAVVPEIGSADARQHDPHDRVRGLPDRGVRPVARGDVAGLVEDGSAHGVRLLGSFSVRSQTHLGTRRAKLGGRVKGVLTGHLWDAATGVC